MPRIKRIHVNQHNIRANKKNQENKPVLSCKTSASNDYGHEVVILDKDGAEVVRVIYSPNSPLSCGARCWIVTMNPVEVIEKDPDGIETGRVSVN